MGNSSARTGFSQAAFFYEDHFPKRLSEIEVKAARALAEKISGQANANSRGVAARARRGPRTANGHERDSADDRTELPDLYCSEYDLLTASASAVN